MDKSAYKAQFFGATSPLSCLQFGRFGCPWKLNLLLDLAMQNRLSTAGRLAKRGLTNCGACPLCKCVPESVDHLFVQCCYTMRLWGTNKEWLGLHFTDPPPPNLTEQIYSWLVGIDV
jgi:hypothetical protein